MTGYDAPQDSGDCLIEMSDMSKFHCHGNGHTKYVVLISRDQRRRKPQQADYGDSAITTPII
jgi:hypothetical protein